VDHVASLDDGVWGTMMCGVITREMIDRQLRQAGEFRWCYPLLTKVRRIRSACWRAS